MQPITFRLFGFPVRVVPGFFLFLAMIAIIELGRMSTLGEIASWCAVITVSLVVHELGHALVSRGLGVRVHGIELAFMHGSATHDRTTPKRQLAISLAGPAAGFGLGAVGLGLAFAAGAIDGGPAWGLPAIEHIGRDLLTVNLMYGLFNLLPILPLDGGNALRSAASWGWGPATGLKVAAIVGTLGAGALAFFGLANGAYTLALIAGWMLSVNLPALRAAGVIR